MDSKTVPRSLTVGLAVALGCGGTTGAGAEADGGAADTGATEGADASDGSDTDDTPIDPPPPADCADPLAAVELTRWMITFDDSSPSRVRAAVANPHGGADLLVADAFDSVELAAAGIRRLDASGQERDLLGLPRALHPQALGIDGLGLLYVASWRDADLQGEQDGIVQRYDDRGRLRDEIEIDLEPYGNEAPVSLEVSPAGWLVVTTAVEYDDQLPGLAGFLRVDRFDPGLALVDAIEAEPSTEAITIDDDGTLYVAADLGSALAVAAVASDGSTRWTTELTNEHRDLWITAGPDRLWVAQQTSDGFGGGRVTTLARIDGALVDSVELATGSLDELRETPYGVAALPCGGAVVISQAELDIDTFVSFTVVGDDGARGEPTALFDDPPLAGTRVSSVRGVSVAANGPGLASAQLSDESGYYHLLMGF